MLLALSGVLVGPSVANHGGREISSLFACDRPVVPPRCTSVGDGLRHRVAFDDSLTDGLAEGMRHAMFEVYGATNLTVIEDPVPTRLTDVIVYSTDYGDNGAAGWVYCPPDAPQGVNAHGHRWCQRQELHLNLNDRYAVFFADDGSRDHVACHELGHTIGLRHWGNPPQSEGPAAETCMNANTPNGPTAPHQFDIDHINAYYADVPMPSRRASRRASRGLELASRPANGGVTALAGTTAEALEAEWYATIEAMTAAADAVVEAEVTSIRPGRTFGGATGAPLEYASLTLRVDDVLAGDLPSAAGSVTLELPLYAGTDALRSLDSLRGINGVFFLRSKGDADRIAGLASGADPPEVPFYRLLTQDALVLNDDGRAAVVAGDHGPLDALAGVSYVEAFRIIAVGR
jgi:hypothetical protein